jgi:hypothetical protein
MLALVRCPPIVLLSGFRVGKGFPSGGVFKSTRISDIPQRLGASLKFELLKTPRYDGDVEAYTACILSRYSASFALAIPTMRPAALDVGSGP